MAVKEIIEIEAKTGQAEKEIEKLTNQVSDLSKAQKETAESTKSIARGVGTLVKGAGIGLAIKAFEKFSEVLSSNQEVADFFSVAMESLSIAFNDLISFLLDNTKPVTDTFEAIFSDPQQAIKDLGQAIKENLIERFDSFVESAGLAGKAIVAFFKGDFAEAQELAKEAGKELVDVYTGVDGTVDRLIDGAEKLATAVADYATETVNAAKANVELQKIAERSAVINQGLIEKYDRQAEQLRQIRDEERNTLAERIKANEDLNAVLDEQEKAMLRNAQAILDSARVQFEKNQNQENEIALIEAQNELLAVQAQIEGFRSEQKANDLALSRELKQVEQDSSQTAIDNLRTEKEANIKLLDEERARIQATIKLEEELYNKQLELINDRLSAEKEGSTAYAEILNERLTLEAEYAAQNKTLNHELSKFNVDLKQQEEQSKLDITGSALTAAQNLAEQGSQTYKALAVAQVILDTFKGIQASFASNAANVGATTLTGGAWPFIQAAAAASFGAANIAGILAVDPRGSSSAPSLPSPSGASAAASVSSPAFNIVAAQQQTNLLTDISRSVGQPVKAYVVDKDITSAQELERNRIRNATF